MTGYARPSTLLEAFDSTLPELSRPPNNQYASVRASGITTENATPPLIFLCNEVQPLLDRADEVLNQPEIKSRIRLNGPPPKLEPAHGLFSENDVIAASTVFILTDVSEVLNIHYSGQWQYRFEASKSSLIKAGGAGNVKAENVRYDLIFYTVNANGTLGKPIAIVEYKKVDMIRYKDFEKGLIENTPSLSQPEIDQAEQNAHNNGSIVYNAEAYLKQISVYARSQKCPHVALFNWDHLMMFTFDTGRATKPFTAGSHAGLVWACETDVKETLMHQCPIRKAMLGWLLRAFSEHFG